jgi:hypothetical protein
MGKSILSRLGEEIFQILKGSGKSLTLFNEDGKVVYDPSNASRMFVEPDKMMISIVRDGYNSSVCLYISSGTDLNESNLTKLITTLRTTSTRYNMLFNVKKFGYQLAPRDFSYLTATESVMDVRNVVENQLYGTTKSSYQKIGNARLVIRHSASVNEEKRGARGRHINALFVENNMGERFRYPHIHLSGGRAMAFHISQGGTFHDSVGQNIIGLSEQYYHLSNIRHYIRSNNLMENSAIEFSQLDKQLSQIRNICSRIQRPHGYNWFQQEYKPIITMDENQVVVLANKLNISENDELTNSLKWATGLTTTQLEDIAMNVVAERELEQQDKFLTYAKDYYLKRLAKAGEPAVLSKKMEENSAALAKGLKEILSGRFSAKVIGTPRDDFKTPESEKSYKISIVLEPASGISNDALWNYISDISDKLGHGEKLTKNELLIADKIVAYVDRKLQTGPSKTEESMEQGRSSTLDDVVRDELAQGKSTHTIARELGCPVWKIAMIVDELKQAKEQKTVEAKLPELANIDEWFEQFDPNTVLSNVGTGTTMESPSGETPSSGIYTNEDGGWEEGMPININWFDEEGEYIRTSKGTFIGFRGKPAVYEVIIEFEGKRYSVYIDQQDDVGFHNGIAYVAIQGDAYTKLDEMDAMVDETDETPYDSEPSDVEITIFENEIEEWIRDVVANPVRYGVRLSAPEDVDQPGRIDPDFVSDVLGAVKQGIMISDELWKEDYFFSKEEEIRLQIIDEIKKMYSDLTENELMEMPVRTQSFNTRISNPTSIVTSITPSDVKITKAIWNFLGGSDKIWAILEYNNTIIVVWGRREGNLYGDRNWRKQEVSRAEALARLSKKLREGYKEVISGDRIVDPHSATQLANLMPFLKEVGARVFRTLDVKNTDLNTTLSTTEDIEIDEFNRVNQSQDFIDDIEYNDDEETTDNDIREMEESIKTMLRMAKVR